MKTGQSNLKSTVLLVLCALVAAFFLVIKPKQDEVAEAQAELASSTQALQTARQELASLGPQPDDVELNKLIVQVPRTADTPAFFNQVSQVAVQDGVKVSGITFSQPTTSSAGVGSEVLVSLTADGPRANVDQFLNSIAQLPRLAVINQANVNPVAVAGQPLGDIHGNVTAVLSIVLFTGLAPATK